MRPGCCARALSGHAATAPPRSVMKSRRFTGRCASRACDRNQSTPPASLDHLVCAGEERGRDFKTKCFGGFKVDDQLVFGWLLDRQIAGRFALENTINVRRCSLEQIDYVWSITDESAGLCEQVEWIDRRKSKLSRKRDDQFTMRRCEWIRKNNYTTTRSLHENTKPMINLARVACTNHG